MNRTTRLFFRQSGIARTRSGWQNAQLWAGYCIVKNELTVFDARLYIRVRRLDEAPQRSAAFVATAMACWRITRACFKNIFHFSLRRSKTRSSTPPRAKPKPRVSGTPGAARPPSAERKKDVITVFTRTKVRSARLLHPTTRKSKNLRVSGTPLRSHRSLTFAPAKRQSRALTQTIFETRSKY